MSGHNKWSKIKHKKAATDARKSKVFTKHARSIAVESKKVGGNKNSPSLRAAIERARADLMPNENIERAISKGIGADAEITEEILYETYGGGGVGILISTITDNRNRTSQEIKHILSKFGYQLGVPGSASWAFTKHENGFVPNAPIILSEEQGESLALFVEALEEHDDVQDVYTTADDAY
jgi:YebC/PmpR family DNA-binding regulatory protein